MNMFDYELRSSVLSFSDSARKIKSEKTKTRIIALLQTFRVGTEYIMSV